MRTVVLLAALTLCPLCLAQEGKPPPIATYCADPAHTGYYAGGLGKAKRREHPVVLFPTTGFGTSYLYCVDGKDGKQLWRIDRPNTAFHTPPTIHAGIAYGCQNRGVVYAVSIETGKVLWERKTGGTHNSPPVLSGGRLYLTSSEHDEEHEPTPRIMALDAKTGKKLWHQRLGESQLAHWWAPTVTGGRVYMSVDKGRLFAFDAKSGKAIASRSLGKEIGKVSASGDRLYTVVQGRKLVALEAKTLKTVWTTGQVGDKEEGPLRGPAISGGVVVAPLGEKLVAVEDSTGKPRWSYPIGRGIGTPVISGGLVYMITRETFHVVDLKSGKRVWHRKVILGGSEGDMVVAVARGVAYMITTSEDRHPTKGERAILVAHDAKTGKERWRIIPEEGRCTLLSNPVLAD